VEMTNSILDDTKKPLGLQESDTSFDPDVTMHINSTLGIISQLGLGPDPMIFVEDATRTWDELSLTPIQLNLCKSYMYLRVRMLFDPPTLSFLLDAMKEQITELEHRLSEEREKAIPVPTPPVNLEEEFTYYDEVIESL
jgi:hypothetical protein